MKRNPWPYAIIAYFAVFISGVVVWVSFAMRHEDQLVRPDYYEHEIQYQTQIDRATRTAAIRSEVEINYRHTNQTVVIALPAGAKFAKAQGKIHLYRPSDSKLDREFALALDDRHSQTVDVSTLADGFWKVRLNWSAADGEYYAEQPVSVFKE